MKKGTISRGGQISVPAAIRRRWGTTAVLIDDRGDSLVIRPLPADPIGAARGSLPSRIASEETRAMLRREEDEAEQRRYGKR
jgi:bifunctional DNA-binding transcriptional regulator/antitoxin component of YhaV-PrlF toxin-antitoxin module